MPLLPRSPRWKYLAAALALAGATGLLISQTSTTAAAATGPLSLKSYSSDTGLQTSTTSFSSPAEGACLAVNQPPPLTNPVWTGINDTNRIVEAWSGANCTGSWTRILPGVPMSLTTLKPVSVRIGVH
ncbi:hypothetical protein [Actinokineospora globicatena]|uniref:hypothetical protein n=1 Tax=Actinokineospora globicatena TaxID=103729 RepID=UPI0020A462E1|nr:hypothetical protein [Actinokineospora globicatena]MCP2303696.1 hypothetical protein [Actinokineospora globicatena]GLW79166.1 hypothetical protein Aglo01_36480 [Actinokineospora globicatena]GLW86424.1 hypothetical protein Aglo02_40630 [Actinokineospora globicatena]